MVPTGLQPAWSLALIESVWSRSLTLGRMPSSLNRCFFIAMLGHVDVPRNLLIMLNNSYWKWLICKYIVDFAINMVIFCSYLSLPEGYRYIVLYPCVFPSCHWFKAYENDISPPEGLQSTGMCSAIFSARIPSVTGNWWQDAASAFDPQTLWKFMLTYVNQWV